jgi:SAM-dependent methyltransferase
VEGRFYRDVNLPHPTLDVGCGDGHFAKVAFGKPPAVGLDPWTGPIREAKERGAYGALVQADAGHTPFSDHHFASAVSNSVLEHIPHVDQVLQEIARVLKPDAPFYFCVPNHRFLRSLSVAIALDKAGFGGLAERYRSFFNRISRHHHCDPPEVWATRLQGAGFHLAHWWHYFSPEALRVLEWGHYLGLPSLLSRWLTGRWILSPTRWNLALTDRLLRPHFEGPLEKEHGTYTFFIARRAG